MMSQEPHPITDSAGVPEVLQQVLARALKKSADQRYGSAAQMMLDLVLARRELGSVSRTDKLLGMSQRVAAAETAARAGPATVAASPGTSPGAARHGERTGPLPGLPSRLSRPALGVLIAAALAVLVVLVLLLRARL
jgi:hypothetical protein